MADPAYSRLLIQNTSLPLNDILALDRVQKKLPIPKEVAAYLRKQNLIEGRLPNIYVAAKVANSSVDKADYIKSKAQDDEFYSKLIVDYLTNFKVADRQAIDLLLMDKLSSTIGDDQKKRKIGNLLTKLRRSEVIESKGIRMFFLQAHYLPVVAERKKYGDSCNLLICKEFIFYFCRKKALTDRDSTRG